MDSNIDNTIKLGKLSVSILVISGVVILFSFIAPILFTQQSSNGISFNGTGEIGDTISGLMNPFIAISGVLLTFLAFYIQFKANKLQRELFRIELDEQKEQYKKTQFENQFYEMLRLHKENVNEIRITNPNNDFVINGRHAFALLLKEFELCYFVAKFSFDEVIVKNLVNEAYGVFFHGLNKEILRKHKYFQLLDRIKDSHGIYKYKDLKSIVRNEISIELGFNLEYPIFQGYSSQLAHYYRHLFQTVKFIVNQDYNFLTYEEKRKYLRILRAQLSNQEQVMLFYNWLSKFGQQWENETNRFFTDFRMIHNLYQEILISEVELKSFFNLDEGYRKEMNREKDPLFEFQSWE